jgi:hypothetical protein
MSPRTDSASYSLAVELTGLLGARTLPFCFVPAGNVRGLMTDYSKRPATDSREKQTLRGSAPGTLECPFLIFRRAGGGPNHQLSPQKAAVPTNIPRGDKVADGRTSGLNDALSYRTNTRTSAFLEK